MRVQLALNVANLEAAIDFYAKLFGAEVHKRRPGYASFALDEPPLKLVLFESPEASQRLNHLGVEVFADADVRRATERLEAAGLEPLVEEATTCCYATQNKVWARDPDGAPWEFYRVVEDSPRFGGAEPAAASASSRKSPSSSATRSATGD